MTIEKNLENDKLTLCLSGRLDTTTAPELENELNRDLPAVRELVLDMDNLEYISSAGLRVLLSAQKIMNKQGSMRLTGVRDVIMDIFEVTGFDEILTIE
jgi:anti-sigma B factor antagonist